MSFAQAFPGFRLRLTRWGGVFLAGMLVLGLAAVNTGNNALMALLGLALASYVVSGTWSRQVLASTAVGVVLPREVFAGRTAVVEVELENRSRLFPAYGLVLRDGHGRALLVEPRLEPGARRRRSVGVVFPDRGWTILGPWRVEVLLPLGFFLKSKQVVRDERVLVYPRLLTSSSVSARVGGDRRSAWYLVGRGREGEVTQLREYRDGDDRRQLHWKQTARQQRPIVVDRQRQADDPLVFVLDPRVRDPSDAEVRERFETLVSDVATGVVQRLERGDSVALVVGATSLPPVNGVDHAARLLAVLAEVEPVGTDAPEPSRPAGGTVATWRAEESSW